ncbi:hypothetical protein LCGC14_2462290, partial [marine sediment metagenome]
WTSLVVPASNIKDLGVFLSPFFICDSLSPYSLIEQDGKVKFVVLPINTFQAILDRLEDESEV